MDLLDFVTKEERWKEIAFQKRSKGGNIWVVCFIYESFSTNRV